MPDTSREKLSDAAIAAALTALAGWSIQNGKLHREYKFADFPHAMGFMVTAVPDGLIPGAVLLSGQGERIVHRKAYGNRALVPSREPMTVDTIFDIASLTKVTATTPALMKLFEQGKLRLNDPVTAYLPEFQG